MKNLKLIAIASCFLALNACKKEETAQKPTITTESVKFVTSNSVTVGGNVISNGGSVVTECGVYIGTLLNPETTGEKFAKKTDIGPFSIALIGLEPNTTYYVKAFATNKVGTSFGSLQSFRTQIGLPVLTTANISAITITTALCGGSISSDGGFSIIARGTIWSTSQNPTLESNQGKTTDGTGIGNFTSSLTDLIPNTTYYVRAYATNNTGTTYGNQQTFKTSIVEMNITTTIATSITSSSAISGGNISSEKGVPEIIGRGVVWSRSQNPTLENSEGKTSETTVLWDFVSNLTTLKSNTNYYVRAYVTNKYGTQYGNQISFTTLNTVTDIVGNIYNTAVIGTQTWMVENLKTTKYRNGDDIPNIIGDTEWRSQTKGAYCWYENNIANKNNGALYNFYTVIDSRNLCPVNWHVATKDDWTRF